jgi:hypothetical protein
LKRSKKRRLPAAAESDEQTLACATDLCSDRQQDGVGQDSGNEQRDRHVAERSDANGAQRDGGEQAQGGQSGAQVVQPSADATIDAGR